MKKIIGTIISDKMDKTAVVKVSRWTVHPLYKKRFLTHKKYHTHNDIGAKIDDEVKISATRPISKTKRWRIIEVMNKKG